MKNMSRILKYAAIAPIVLLLAAAADGCRTASPNKAVNTSAGAASLPGKLKSASRPGAAAVSGAFVKATASSGATNTTVVTNTPVAAGATETAGGRSDAGSNSVVIDDLKSALHVAMERPSLGGSAGVAFYTNAIQEGDVLSITFDFSTNFNTVTKIALDGMCNLRGIAPVKAAGKTPQQLQEELAALYKAYVKDESQTNDEPLSVSVISTTACFYVSGAVLRPGKIPLERPMTALEGIMEAGGYDSTRAKLADVTVIRMENGRMKTYPVNVKRMLEGKDQEPFYLKPFDVLNVPTKTFNF
jgi:polysaccharide export outer membrane protein